MILMQPTSNADWAHEFRRVEGLVGSSSGAHLLASKVRLDAAEAHVVCVLVLSKVNALIFSHGFDCISDAVVLQAQSSLASHVIVDLQRMSQQGYE